ncbi:hypothetical protein TBLA_0E04040 [Henningerozyma blattae CBS 6284]|uniref:Uncharacterized protein n=1 Tax=Henningerozyma blattae (strain ATCC 34711 / CBS 6284 / DSM 70876 / NBRC 10599 / NRRL Y-10934 / UCD 77-7) TaxID=1071380 RepID=I2H507_HENB6|nr:hypothetical protein TBLA_0E04040 [Tetrapisispora blattae CBS 6284]CCH61459.1 hypothetical protein TBLA_0E04040 [Tetrapisispora blattae CBS 6284]
MPGVVFKPEVLILYQNEWDIADNTPEWEKASKKVNFIHYRITTVQDLQEYLQECGANVLWVTDEFVSKFGGPMEFYEYLPYTLKLIVVPWVGCEFLNIPKLKEKHIRVCNIGPTAADDVADVALYLAISTARLTSFWEMNLRFIEKGNIPECKKYVGSSKVKKPITNPLECDQNQIEKNRFYLENLPKKTDEAPSEDELPINIAQNYSIGNKKMISLRNKTALIIGFGSIGKLIAERLYRLYHMKIKYYKRKFPTNFLFDYRPQFCSSLDDNRTWSDVDLIVLALPNNPSTTNIINEKRLNLCKDGVRIVNVGRGECIDEDALIDALDEGKVGSCGLDVFKNESEQINPKLLNRWDVTILPHVGSTVEDLIYRQTKITLKNIEDVLQRGGKGLYPVET